MPWYGMVIVYLTQYTIGYEPADLTVHPPPKKNDRGWVHFFRICI